MKTIAKSCLFIAMIWMFMGAGVAQATITRCGTMAPSPCNGGKYKCVYKLKSCLLGCYHRSLFHGVSLDIACAQKCRIKFSNPLRHNGCIDRLNIKNQGCLQLGDGPILRSKVDAHVLDVNRRLVPGGGIVLNRCAAYKHRCFAKYDACILNLIVKIATRGGPPCSPNYSLCDKYLRGIGSCFWRLEAKYPFSSPSRCLTFNDEHVMANLDDIFVSDLIDTVSGIKNLNTQRCTGNTFTQCTTDGDCAVAGGTCQHYFGGPLPMSAGGIATCVTNQWSGGISGTFDAATGASAGTALLLRRTYVGGTMSQPCPVCVGASESLNDGVAGGTCSSGTRTGLPCDGNGESAEPSFGITSLDCPPSPGSLIALGTIDVSNTNQGTVTATVSAASPTCNAQPGKKCLCASCSGNSSIACRNDADCTLAGAGTCTNAAGEPRRANACIDDTSTGPDESICATTVGNRGECPLGPVDPHCAVESFRGCLNDLDCPARGDYCSSAPLRPCYPGYNGSVGDVVTATGAVDTPIDHTGTASFASVFCVPPTSSAAVNLSASPVRDA